MFIKIIKFKSNFFHYTFKYPSINNGVCNFFTPKIHHNYRNDYIILIKFLLLLLHIFFLYLI